MEHAMTFGQNGHVATVWWKCNDMHIKKRICTIFHIGNVFHFTDKIKYHFLGFYSMLIQKWMDPASTNFETNGHGASVWSHCNDIHIKGKSLYNLPHRCISFHGHNNISLFGDFYSIFVQIVDRSCPDFCNKWSWGFCLMQM